MRRPVQWNYAALGYKSGTLYDRKKVGNKKSVCFNMFFFDTGLVYDAADYWDRGTRLWQDGKFSFLNINGFRGYIYPLYCGICNLCGGAELDLG